MRRAKFLFCRTQYGKDGVFKGRKGRPGQLSVPEFLVWAGDSTCVSSVDASSCVVCRIKDLKVREEDLWVNPPQLGRTAELDFLALRRCIHQAKGILRGAARAAVLEKLHAPPKVVSVMENFFPFSSSVGGVSPFVCWGNINECVSCAVLEIMYRLAIMYPKKAH